MSAHESRDVEMDQSDEGLAGVPARSVEGWIILVVNLHEETSEEDLQDTFAEYGTIKNLHLNLDRRTGYVKGYAFIEYARKEEAESAIKEVDATQILGQEVTVGFAFMTPLHEKSERKQEERHRSRSPERSRAL